MGIEKYILPALDKHLTLLKYKKQPSGCEDCDFLNIREMHFHKNCKWVGICMEYDTHGEMIFVITEDTLTDDLTHIKPPLWCPGG